VLQEQTNYDLNFTHKNVKFI